MKATSLTASVFAAMAPRASGAYIDVDNTVTVSPDATNARSRSCNGENGLVGHSWDAKVGCQAFSVIGASSSTMSMAGS